MEEILDGGKKYAGYSIPTKNASILVILAKRGMLACGYINLATADRLGDAAAIVTGVVSHSDMLSKKVVAVSKAAADMGVKVGMSGSIALEKMDL